MAIIICGYYNFKILFSEKNKSQQCIMSYLCKKNERFIWWLQK